MFIGVHDLWDLLGHLFNLIYLAAFMARDRRRTQGLIMGAATLELVYFLRVADEPLWSGVIWSGAYLAYAGVGLLREQLSTTTRLRTGP